MRRQRLTIKKRWSDDELEILRVLASNGLSAKVIGSRLGRSRQSVRSRAMRLPQAIARPQGRDPAESRRRPRRGTRYRASRQRSEARS